MLTDYSKSIHSTERGRVSYKFSFPVINDSDLRVMVVDPADLEQVPLFLGFDYLVAGVGSADGGSIELTAAGQKKAAVGLKMMVKQGQAHQYQIQPTPSGEIGADLSEDEVAVGIDYTDGNRVIYQKTVPLGAVPNASAPKPIPHNVNGMRRFWVERAWMYSSTRNASYHLNYSEGTSLSYNTTICITPEQVIVSCYTNVWTDYQAYCTIRYTKD